MVKLLKEANDLIVLWRKFGPGTEFIDLKVLFHQLVLPKSRGDHCTIVEGEFDSFEGLMAHDKDLGEWRIGVSSRIKLASRRNFTLAHEIGHFIGHRHLMERFECSFEDLNDFGENGFEQEANAFAAHLLMPPDSIRKLTENRKFSHDNVIELASYFGVSKAALAYRWVYLTTRAIGFVTSRDGFYTGGKASKRLYKMGTYFRFGDAVPIGAKVHDLGSPGSQILEKVRRGIWNQEDDCTESSYATIQNGYVYTYLDFAA